MPNSATPKCLHKSTLGSEGKAKLSSLKPRIKYIISLLNKVEEDDSLTNGGKKTIMDDMQQRTTSEKVKKVIFVAYFIDLCFKRTIEETVHLPERTHTNLFLPVQPLLSKIKEAALPPLLPLPLLQISEANLS